MTISDSAVVWVEPIERGDLQLAPGDIKEALAWFKDKTGWKRSGGV